jgi:uncharacterized protein
MDHSSDGSARDRTVLVVGGSTRGFAESAWRAGVQVVACDGFGDLDQQRFARVIGLRPDRGIPYSARAAVQAVGDVSADYAAYVSNLENHPALVARLARGRCLLGNAPSVLRRIRDPRELHRTLARRGVPAPAVRLTAPPPGDRRSWLSKPIRSGGGRGILPWTRGAPVSRDRYLQQRIEGVPVSLAFVADGRTARPFAWSVQLAGRPEFGAAGFTYCGSILCPPNDRSVPGEARARGHAARIASAITAEFGLKGVNVLDLVVRNGRPFPVEVNPRYSASMELAERVTPLSVFDLHLSGCTGRVEALTLPACPIAQGKAILFATRMGHVGDTTSWLEDDDLRDVPRPGTILSPGDPICTIFARGHTVASCRAALARRARRVYDLVDGSRARSA